MWRYCSFSGTILQNLTQRKRMETAMAKGPKKSNRVAKKPKKAEADKLKAKSQLANLQTVSSSDKDRPKKP
jgi:hypothetical protein